MMKTSHLFLTLLCAFFLQSLSANTIYLEYDPACMDRYEYRYKGVKTSLGHIVYHVRLNDREKVVLEVGVESKMDYEKRPANVKRCKDFSLNERVVREINRGDLQVFIVKRNASGYNVSPVGIASYGQINPNGIGVSAVDNIFAYQYTQPANGANLAKRDSEAKIFFNGLLSHTCPKKYLFTKTKQKAGKNYAELTIIPEIGIIEEKTGFNQTDAANNVMELVAVNGVPIENYLRQYCRNGAGKGNFYSNRAGNVSTRPNSGGNSITGLEGGSSGKPNNGKTTTVPGTTVTTVPNTVTSGSTTSFNCPVYKDLDRNIYIDKNTGQPANLSCGGNTYRNGYMEGRPTTTGTTVVTTTVPTTTTSPSTPVTVEPGPSNPYSYCKKVSSQGVHIVQPRETLYGISRLYGLTVNELRNLNGLDRRAVIKPCMELRTTSRPITTAPREEVLVSKDGTNYTHTVQPGETIYQLASRYGFTVDKFKAINGLNSNIISVGQQLRISDCNCPTPEEGGNTSLASNTDLPDSFEATEGRLIVNNTQKRQVHIVKEDETIYSIAKAYNISVAKLRQLNNLEVNELIIPFQRLYLN